MIIYQLVWVEKDTSEDTPSSIGVELVAQDTR